MMTWSEWRDTAEREAARTYGKNHAGAFMAARLAGPAAIVAAVGAAGYGAWWLWDRASTALAGSGTGADGGGFPVWLIVVLLTAGVATLIVGRAVFASGRFGAVVFTFIAMAIVWLGLIAFAVGSHS